MLLGELETPARTHGLCGQEVSARRPGSVQSVTADGLGIGRELGDLGDPSVYEKGKVRGSSGFVSGEGGAWGRNLREDDWSGVHDSRHRSSRPFLDSRSNRASKRLSSSGRLVRSTR